jgi:excisionase family DNA binding protein
MIALRPTSIQHAQEHPETTGCSPMSPNSIALEAPLVASPNQAMRAIHVSRKKLYELINTGELESYTEGKSRRITVKSINEYIERRLAAEATRRGRAASDRNHQLR